MGDKKLPEAYLRSEYISDFESETQSEADSANFSRTEDFDDVGRNGFGKRKLDVLNPPEIKKTVKKPRPVGTQMLNLDAFQRHQKMVNDYLQFYGGSREDFKRDTSGDKRDFDVIKQNHRFMWSDADVPNSWEERLAKRYWEQLFKEYCVADLSRYKENKFGLRWRVQREVVSGKGQFMCGSLFCNEVNFLRSWEVNFAYRERDMKRNALVKLRLCPTCSDKLNFHKQHVERCLEKSNEVPISAKRSCITTDANDPTNSIQDPPGGSSSNLPTPSEDFSVWRNKDVSCGKQSETGEDEFAEYFKDMFM